MDLDEELKKEKQKSPETKEIMPKLLYKAMISH